MNYNNRRNAMDEELTKLQRQNTEFGYQINKISEQFDIITDELKYLDSLIRNAKGISC